MQPRFSKYPSVQRRLTVAFITLGSLISAIIIMIQYANYRTAIRNELRQRLVSITTIAALQQDGDLLLKISSGVDEFYRKLNSSNLKIRDSDADLVYVYTMRKNEGGIYFIVDANRPGDEGIAEFGQPYLEPGPTLVENFDTINKTIIEPDFYTDEFGTFLSAYAPIYSSSNQRVGVLGVDISANRVVSKERDFLRNSLIVFLATIPAIALLGGLFGRLLATPLIQLTEAARKISEGTLEASSISNPGSREVAQLAATFNTMTGKISNLVNTLEDKVAERTAELAQANQKITLRSERLRTIAEMSRVIASIQDHERLLTTITQLISERFGYYHVGIFLLDDQHEYAALNASNSEGGARMLARGHRLRVGEQGMVGSVAQSGEARIALDVGKDAVFFDNPDLPDTRSELTLPLNIESKVIGALDIQSTEPGAFTEEDISTLSVLADQMSVAIQNAQLIRETQIALAESQTLYGRYLNQAWQSSSSSDLKVGYRFSGTILNSLEKPLNTPEIIRALKRGEVVVKDPENENEKSILVVPVKLRDETIGTISVNMPKGEKLDDDNKDIIRAASERIALALENATLLEVSQRRAAKERTIGEISAKIGGLVNIENILQTAIQELGLNLPDTDIAIQFTQGKPDQPA